VNDQRLLYDRELLLLGAKRNAVLELWEVQRYGSDSFGDTDYVSVYGMRPAGWHAKGIRLLGRTAVECTRDSLADAMGSDVAAIAATRLPTMRAGIIDPFAGSGNTLYWLLRHLPGARVVGFESDAEVFRLTRQNIVALALPIEILNTDYVSGLGGISGAPDELLITFIAPPWGNGFDKTSGLDLRRTTPPVTEIVDFLMHRFSHNPQFCVSQIFEIVVPQSISELRARFDWADLRIYELNMPGENHGILLGTKGWAP
jgi:hypothetical protein